MFTCVKYRNMSISIGLLALLLGGCAAKSESVTTDDSQEAATEPEKTPAATPPVSEIIDLFTQHPHTVFQLTTESYSMYVGGELTAQFDAQKELFNIVADDNTVACQYTRTGDLQALSEESTKEEIKNHEQTCKTLVNTLYSALN